MTYKLSTNWRLILFLMAKTGKSWGEVRSWMQDVDEAIEQIELFNGNK